MLIWRQQGRRRSKKSIALATDVRPYKHERRRSENRLAAIPSTKGQTDKDQHCISGFTAGMQYFGFLCKFRQKIYVQPIMFLNTLFRTKSNAAEKGHSVFVL